MGGRGGRRGPGPTGGAVPTAWELGPRGAEGPAGGASARAAWAARDSVPAAAASRRRTGLSRPGDTSHFCAAASNSGFLNHLSFLKRGGEGDEGTFTWGLIWARISPKSVRRKAIGLSGEAAEAGPPSGREKPLSDVQARASARW